MNKLYFLFALFLVVINPTNISGMNNYNLGQIPNSPLDTESVIKSVFKSSPYRSANSENNNSDSYSCSSPGNYQEPNPSSAQTNGISAGAIIHIKHKVKNTNWEHFARCNFPRCNAIIHMSYAKQHLMGHLKNSPEYKKTDTKQFFTQLKKPINPKPLLITSEKELKVERLN
ncbi:MAG: hypothetical protein ACOYT8_06130 [Candidatus Dependentiae bacterium]